MPRTKIDGNTIDDKHALNVIEAQRYSANYQQLFAGDDQVEWDFLAPATGQSWVLGGITISFDALPILTGMLTVDVAGDMYWGSFVGQTPAAIEPGSPATFHFLFRPAMKFEEDTALQVNWIGGDPATIGLISFLVWQEDDICY